MTLADLLRLTLLSALWGASFLFMRIVGPELGPAWTTECRVLIAGLALLALQYARGQRSAWRAHWRPLLVVGAFNTALPFTLLTFAALSLTAGYLAILNATASMWGALIGWLWLKRPLTRSRVAGALLGVLGVALVVRIGPLKVDGAVLLACVASLAAACSYGWSANYLRRLPKSVPIGSMVAETQLAAALATLVAVPLAPPRVAVPSLTTVLGTLGLAFGCTALAYVLYFRLLASIGAHRTLTVTLLVPVFALLWGALFLGEEVTGRMLLGCAVVLAATWLFVQAKD